MSELATPLPGAAGLEGLYETHAPDLRRRCLRLTRDAHAADDLMQEVFVRFLTRFPTAPPGMNVGAYLQATARNVLWKQLRDSHEVSDGEIESTVGADDDLDRDPERSMLLGEQQRLVRRCAAVLTGRQRHALTMRDVEGRSYDEISSELGIGTGAVMQVISRARARLRVAVRRANVDLDALAPECRAMLGPLSDYLDGRAASTEAEIEAHLAVCDSCCSSLASFQEAGSRLRGLLPFMPLGGLLSQLPGRGRGVRSASHAVGAHAATHAPLLTRIGSAISGNGDGPVGAVGIGAIATAAVLAVSGGGLVVAHELGGGGGHRLVAARAQPKTANRTFVPQRVSPTPAVAHVTLPPRSYGHPYSPAVAPASSRAAPAGRARADKKVVTRPAMPAITPLQTLAASEPAKGGRTTPPAASPRAEQPTAAVPAAAGPPTLPAVILPAVKVPVGKVPVVTTPVVTVAPVTTPTVPIAPVVVPPIVTPAVPFGASASFAVLAGSGVTNTGPSVLTGDLGSFPTPAITGLATLTLRGVAQGAGAVAQQAKTDLVAAYDSAAGKAAGTTITADIGGRTLLPGVYRSASSIGLTGAVTLDGQGNPDAVFVFQAGSTLTTASASEVLLANGARACNVFWQVGSSGTLGTGSIFRGSIIALTSVTVTTGVTVTGRVLARNGAVTLDSDTITRPDC